MDGTNRNFKGKMRPVTPNEVRHRANGTSVLTLWHKGTALAGIIDTADYEAIKDYHFYVVENKDHFYVRTMVNGRQITLNNLLVPGSTHLDSWGLNNRRGNLVVANTSLRNAAAPKRRPTSSIFKNVVWQNGKWVAYSTFKGKRTFLGYYDQEHKAGERAQQERLKLFGDFAM